MDPIRTLAAIAATLAVVASAQAADIQSAYTEINLDACLVMESGEFGASFACPGYRGMPLYVAEGDLRFFVSYGWNAPDERAASQTIPQFNTINSTLEWRLTNKTGAYKPFATILRWIIDDIDDKKGDEILVVTKIEPGNTCHVAYVNTRQVPNANEVARQWADTTAPEFNCKTDEPYHVPS